MTRRLRPSSISSRVRSTLPGTIGREGDDDEGVLPNVLVLGRSRRWSGHRASRDSVQRGRSDGRTHRPFEPQHMFAGKFLGTVGVAGGDGAQQFGVFPDVFIDGG